MDDEDICLRCGKCCKIKNRLDKKMFFEHNRDCKYLRRISKTETRCIKYDIMRKNKDTGVGNFCTTAKKGVELGIMPVECPYVSYYTTDLKKYKYNVRTK